MLKNIFNGFVFISVKLFNWDLKWMEVEKKTFLPSEKKPTLIEIPTGEANQKASLLAPKLVFDNLKSIHEDVEKGANTIVDKTKVLLQLSVVLVGFFSLSIAKHLNNYLGIISIVLMSITVALIMYIIGMQHRMKISLDDKDSLLSENDLYAELIASYKLSILSNQRANQFLAVAYKSAQRYLFLFVVAAFASVVISSEQEKIQKVEVMKLDSLVNSFDRQISRIDSANFEYKKMLLSHFQKNDSILLAAIEIKSGKIPPHKKGSVVKRSLNTRQ